MIITLSSVRGAPGVSTWTMLLAAAWPGESERVVLEADLDGGVAGARYGVGVDPGVGELVARLRHGGDVGDVLAATARRIDARGWLVPGPESPLVARRIWAASGVVDEVAAVAQTDPRIWLVDAGRLRPGSPATSFVSRSAVAIIVSGDAPADVVQVPERVNDLRATGATVAVLVSGSPSYPLSELAAFFGTDHVMVGPRIDLAAINLVAREWTDRRLRRSGVWRSAVGIAADIDDLVTAEQMAAVPSWQAPIADPDPAPDGLDFTNSGLNGMNTEDLT